MTKKPPNPKPTKSKTQAYFEYMLLTLCLAVIALRTTITEGPTMQSTALASNLGDSLYSLSVSAVLIMGFILWIVWSVCSRSFIYKQTDMEIGLLVFCIGAIVAGLAAADKRLAITDIVVFLAPLLTAFLLIQILDSQPKIKLMLAVIAALGVISAYQCADQFFVSNQITIEQYEKDPQSMLSQLNIETGSFKQFLFEHRLYSKGVRGFFTTRNSAGSFALMALFSGIALFVEKFKNRKSDPSCLRYRYLFGCGLGIAFIFFCFCLTCSKGAFIGLFFAMIAFLVLLLFGNWLKAHKRAVIAACLLLAIISGGVVISYGLSHGRLPGGGSMLVRWQYWHASAKMYADHPLTGVGPGNFSDYYTHYKPAAALETVADPHNFPLSILTQYGPLGLLGFMAILLVPLLRLTGPASASVSVGLNPLRLSYRTHAILFLAAVSFMLLLIRPILMPETFADRLDVIIYVIVTMYIAQAAVFVIAFVLFAGPLLNKQTTKIRICDTHTTIAIFCAVLAVALHNLVDFAIFEPGVLTTFWALMACLIAIDYHTKSRPPIVIELKPFVKMLILIAALVTCWAYFSCVFIPVAKSTTKIRQANVAIRPERAHELLRKAAGDDVLSFSALYLNSGIYMSQYEMMSNKNRNLLLSAESCLKDAIKRNNVEFKNFERLTDVYRTLAETSTGREKNHWLDKAFEAASQAVERYPGCGRLHFKLAAIADQMSKTEIAIEHYAKAVEIEDKYRAQFKQLYPEHKDVVSRIDNKDYKYAKERMAKLAGKANN
jgi:O-antigen ligase